MKREPLGVWSMARRNLTVLISSAEITFGKIVIQALMASSVRPPRNEQVVQQPAIVPAKAKPLPEL